ncbi:MULTISPECIES: hypothetical protein [Mucilaginibacter]|uniref:Uncharacterized protein n=1 Tax=Mucilaginibacter lappiensis TaxID=354630 RepID=A0A1N7DG81_9SPHI|nr:MULTISPECIES: hypothetical protein [Mucilaginibacter]MBB6111291.1 hypothetical protein [Mucilaginibacter lappiensis]MBB6129567.1 hypothetical protein [Mucilaginibacter lappiensis]NHA05972.1 hypothetical protein [Mucilaginibacter inviolabilis]SIR74790.1 hypothetical protein SAMN05421821_111101 [Mucilaginibacter lappiensis]
MDETFTTTLNGIANQALMDENGQDNLGADDLIFYNSIRADLDLLNKKPKVQTIHQILDYSKSLR